MYCWWESKTVQLLQEIVQQLFSKVRMDHLKTYQETWELHSWALIPEKGRLIFTWELV